MTRRPLRILQVAPWSVHGRETGGMAAVVRDLTAELRDRGHRVDILANAWHARKPIREGPELRLRLPRPPERLSLLSWTKWLLHREEAARRLRALCREQGIDVLHAHYAGTYLTVLRRARVLGGPPYVVTCHRGDVLGMPELTPPRQNAVRTGIAGAASVIAVSRWLSREAEATFGLDHVDTVPNGFRSPWREVPDRRGVEARLGRPLPARYAVMVANMRPYKGHTIALDAWRQLRDQSDLPLVLVGGGPDFEHIRALATAYGLDDRVIFCGYLPRLTTLGVMAHALMVVAPSQSEGHPIFALEAGALARPLVCSAIPPLTDIVEHEETGLTFAPKDPVGLVKAIVRVDTDLELANSLGKKFKHTVERDFSMNQIVDRYINVLTSACERPT
jgi:glycogen(starch) synthase